MQEDSPSSIHEVAMLQQALSTISIPSFKPREEDIATLEENGYITLFDYSTITKEVRTTLKLQYRLFQAFDKYLEEKLIVVAREFPKFHQELNVICEKKEFRKLREEISQYSESQTLSYDSNWLSRDIEKSIKEIFQQRSILAYVCGTPANGKTSTTTIKILKELGRSYVKIDVVNDEVALCASINSKFQVATANIYEVGKLFEQLVERGQILLLDEIQNASLSFQSILQSLCDTIDREKLLGGIIITGSEPKLVDLMLTSSKPLFGRFLHTFTISKDSSLEKIIDYL